MRCLSWPVPAGECLGGALWWKDLYQIAQDVGFRPPRLVTASPITIDNRALESVVGEREPSPVPGGEAGARAESAGVWRPGTGDMKHRSLWARRAEPQGLGPRYPEILPLAPPEGGRAGSSPQQNAATSGVGCGRSLQHASALRPHKAQPSYRPRGVHPGLSIEPGPLQGVCGSDSATGPQLVAVLVLHESTRSWLLSQSLAGGEQGIALQTSPPSPVPVSPLGKAVGACGGLAPMQAVWVKLTSPFAFPSGDCRFVSATFRLFKVPPAGAGGRCQAIYNGGIPGHEQELVFDANFTFKVSRDPRDPAPGLGVALSGLGPQVVVCGGLLQCHHGVCRVLCATRDRPLCPAGRGARGRGRGHCRHPARLPVRGDVPDPAWQRADPGSRGLLSREGSGGCQLLAPDSRRSFLGLCNGCHGPPQRRLHGRRGEPAPQHVR